MKDLTQYINEQMVTEMATMNNITTSGPLARNKVKIEMRSNDNNPPHVHIIFENYNVVFYIENGKFMKYAKNSPELSSGKLRKLEEDFKNWLNEFGPTGATNHLRIVETWIMWHPDDYKKYFSIEFLKNLYK